MSEYSGSYSHLNGEHSTNISEIDFIRAAFTLGAQRYSNIYKFGWRGILHRFGICISAIAFLNCYKDNLVLSERFQFLDKSEKTALSYWYGMIFTKIIADQVMDIRWLQHVDKMITHGDITLSSNAKQKHHMRRCDLAGKSRNNSWHVFEAKGRSSRFQESKLLEDAKEQAQSVIKIYGLAPTTCSASIVSLFKNPITILLADPRNEENSNKDKWEISNKAMFESYYKPIIEYIRVNGVKKQTYEGNEFYVAQIFPFTDFELAQVYPCSFFNLRIGLLSDIYKDPLNTIAYIDKIDKAQKDKKIGSDGIAIFGWSDEWNEQL